jgi:hypothetical protein
MLTASRGGETRVEAVLPHALVTERAQGLDQFRGRSDRGGFSRGEYLVAHKVQPDDLGHLAGHAVAKMALHGLAHVAAQLLQAVALGEDRMAQGRRRVTATRLR